MDVSEFDKWAIPTTSEKLNNGLYCAYSVPNVWVVANFLHGGDAWNRIVNLGGIIGSFIGTDLFTYEYKVMKLKESESILNHINNNLWGLVVFGHGDSNGDNIYDGSLKFIISQKKLRSAISKIEYKVAKAFLMQCYSSAGKHEDEWKKISNYFYGYTGVNGGLIDW